MAIARAVARLLLEHAALLQPTGTVLQLGPQVVHASESELRRYAEAVGLPDRPPAGPGRAGQLFGLMGFDESPSLDLHDPQATHQLDLNRPMPDDLVDRFDAVFDGGTMEHVYSTAQVLENVHRALKVGGVAIHLAPTSNYVDHGYFSFSPRFFHDHYVANGYRLEAIEVLHHSRRWARGPYWAVPYRPGDLERWSMGGFERGQLLTLSIARRTPEATIGARPSDDELTPTRPTHPAARVVAAVARRLSPGTSVLGRRPGPFARRARRL